MDDLDKDIAQRLNDKHTKAKLAYNRGKTGREVYSKGESVWVLRPKPGAGTHKISSWWVGPAKVF